MSVGSEISYILIIKQHILNPVKKYQDDDDRPHSNRCSMSIITNQLWKVYEIEISVIKNTEPIMIISLLVDSWVSSFLRFSVIINPLHFDSRQHFVRNFNTVFLYSKFYTISQHWNSFLYTDMPKPACIGSVALFGLIGIIAKCRVHTSVVVSHISQLCVKVRYSPTGVVTCFCRPVLYHFSFWFSSIENSVLLFGVRWWKTYIWSW